MTIMYLGDVPLGDTIEVSIDGYRAVRNWSPNMLLTIAVCVVARHRDSLIAVAWKQGQVRREPYGWEFTRDRKWVGTGLVREAYIGVCDYDRYVWLDQILQVKSLAPTVRHPNQKCAVCGLPAPHADPNKGNEFMCLSCALLVTL